MARPAGAGEVGGAGAGHEAHLRQRGRAQVAVGQQADADGDVHAVFGQVDDLVDEVQVDLDVRVAAQEAGQRADDVAAAEHRGRRHRQQPAGVAVPGQQRFLGAGQFTEDVAGARQELLAGVGQHQSPRAAVEEPRTQLGLQRVDLARHGRHGHVLPTGDLREAAVRGDGEKGVQGFDHEKWLCEFRKRRLRSA